LRTLSGGRRAAVLGRPIGHSLSPALHRAAYAALGLEEWRYDAIELDESGFAPWFQTLGPEWSGLSLTMPLKRVVIPLLDRVTDQAALVGAVNTVTWSAGGTVGTNTDVYGIVQALRSAGLTSAPTACIVGAGATAASAVAALAELGCERLVVLARSPERAGAPLEVAEKLGVKAEVAALDARAPVVSAEAVVLTLPGPAAGDWATDLRPHLTGRPAGVLLDVSYHPWPTPAAALWTEVGGAAVGGFEMLLHQAAEQVRLMTGRSAPLAEMRVAGEKALASR
jgi:shikimate dehydrogenase